MCVVVGCRGLLVLSIAVACCWTAKGLPNLLPDDSFSYSSSSDGVPSSLPCMRKGEIFLHGEPTVLNDCEVCVCDNSTLTCQIETCPQLFCSPSERVKQKGGCCQICSNSKFVAKDLPCKYEDISARHGEHVNPTDCSSCDCDNAKLTCQYRTCPPLFCKDRVKVKGQCCGYCPVSA